MSKKKQAPPPPPKLTLSVTGSVTRRVHIAIPINYDVKIEEGRWSPAYERPTYYPHRVDMGLEAALELQAALGAAISEASGG